MDPRLWELLQEGGTDDVVAAIIRLRTPGADPPPGVRLVARFGEIATCRFRRGEILRIRRHPMVASLKAPLAYSQDRDAQQPVGSSRSRFDLPYTGKGCVVGVVDWGCDFAHRNFRHADGSTRLLALWDQKAASGNNVYGYGAVYPAAQINRALNHEDPYAVLGYDPAASDLDGQGTHGAHVLDIAAGNRHYEGDAGIAPEADLVFVHLGPPLKGEADSLGDSVSLLEAVDFIVRTAGRRPCVINLSMGRHAGPHDGSSLVEQALDRLLELRHGLAVVQSTGNYFGLPVHVSGRLHSGDSESFEWIIEADDRTSNELDLWYSSEDRVEVRIESPDGALFGPLRPGDREELRIRGNRVGRAYHRRLDPNNASTQAQVFLHTNAPPGAWRLHLHGEDIVDGRFDAWVERDSHCAGCQSVFDASVADRRTTTGTICNGRRTIAVGAYDGRSPSRPLAPFSSSGPTRDGRRKPDLVAPGVGILAARSASRHSGGEPLTVKSGTSMAAPHVTGTIALMFEAAGRLLPISETRRLLLANTDPPAPEVDADRVGAGYLNIGRAVRAAESHTRSDAIMRREDHWTEDARKRFFVLLSGGPGPYNDKDVEHDKSWANYVTAPLLLTGTKEKKKSFAAADESVVWMVYKPAYEKRWKQDSKEKARKDAVKKVTEQGFTSYVDLIEHRAKDRGWTLLWLSKAGDLWTELGKLKPISRFWYWGHARQDLWLTIDHDASNAAVAPASSEIVRVTDIRGKLKSNFQNGDPSRASRFIGCNTQDFAIEWSKTYAQWSEGVAGKIDFGSLSRTGGEPCLVSGATASYYDTKGKPHQAESKRVPMVSCKPSNQESDDADPKGLKSACPRGCRCSRCLEHGSYRKPPVLPAGGKGTEWMGRSIELIGVPGGRLTAKLEPGDVVLRSLDGWRHTSVLVNGELLSRPEVERSGYRAEKTGIGRFGHVREHGPQPHTDADGYFRRILDESGRVPANQVVLRLREAESDVQAAGDGRSGVAGHSLKDWPDKYNRPAKWQGQVYGLVVHTTGSGPLKYTDPFAWAVSYYKKTRGPHYVNGWAGIEGSELLQIADENVQANGVGTTHKQDRYNQRLSIQRGRFEADLPDVLVRHWKARWPGLKHSLALLPAGETTVNPAYVHVECVPCTDGSKQFALPMRPGLRFTKAQHDAVARLAVDVAQRNGWPADEQWWRTARLLGHEDLTPISRHDKHGGWDPGYLRDKPYFDWDYVYQQIESLVTGQRKGEEGEDAEEWPDLATETALPAGRKDIGSIPLLAGHAGKNGPDLILLWNGIPPAAEAVDLVVHLHGFACSRSEVPLDIRKHVLPRSGLDWSDPDALDTAAGRARPTLALIPRGSFYGGATGRGYYFPALLERDGLQQLIDEGLREFAQHSGRERVRVNRLILTAHSGGGRPLLALLQWYDPHEVHLFDALYDSPDPLINWVRKRIRRDVAAEKSLNASLADYMAQGGGALRIAYLPAKKAGGSETASESLAVEAAIRKELPAGSRLRPWYRAEAVPRDHCELPRYCGWRFLASAGRDLPGMPAADEEEPSLAAAIVRIAKEELDAWTSGNFNETDPQGVARLKQYYKAVGEAPEETDLTSPAWQDANPWSAVFVSYVMKTAGAGKAFRYSKAHVNYLVAARDAALDGQAGKFWAYGVREVSPEPGDILVQGRKNSCQTLTLSNARDQTTHGDIVVEVVTTAGGDRHLRAVGGNVNNRVASKTIPLDAGGRIPSLQAGIQCPYVAIVRPPGGDRPAPEQNASETPEALLAQSFEQGVTSHQKLTDLLFYNQYPMAQGRPLSPDEQAKWKKIHDESVKPFLIPTGFSVQTRKDKKTGTVTWKGLTRYGGERVGTKLKALVRSGKLQISDEDIDTMQRVANVETGGVIQAVNSWDSAVMSIGFMQWTLRYGELQNWISAAALHFARYGIALDGAAEYAWSKNRQRAILGASIDQLRWGPWAKRFFEAGLDDEIVAVEAQLAVKYFARNLGHLKTALARLNNGLSLYESFQGHYAASLYLRGLFQEASNNRPAYTIPGVISALKLASSMTTSEFVTELADQLILAFGEDAAKAQSIIKKTESGAD